MAASSTRRCYIARGEDHTLTIGKAEFRLDEVYVFEAEMHAAYPQNSHVRDKIRQQMQVLRDLGYVEFVGRGEYAVVR